MRVLGRLRLSRSTDESTSIERQKEIIEQWAQTHDHTVVGWAEDVDVSRSVDPFDTPELGKWLNDRAPEWDIVATWKLDRLATGSIYLNRVMHWCFEHDKVLISVTENFDLSTWVGRMIANVIAGVAEGELEAIRERQLASRQKLRESARWAGGKPPYGYVKVPHPSGTGWALSVDKQASTVIDRIVNDMIDGRPMGHIVRELNDEGYRPPAAYHETVKAGQPKLKWAPDEARTGKWKQTAMRNMLRNNALRGYVHHNNTAVRDDDGSPLRYSEPLIDSDRWELLQASLDQIQNVRRNNRRPESSPLAGLVNCFECGDTLFHTRYNSRGHEYRYYRCDINKCTVHIPAGDVESMVEETFLEHVGDWEVQARVWVSGDSRETELREAVTAFDELSATAGKVVSATAKQRLQKQLSALDVRIAELESSPSRESHWEYRSTGGTYREAWEAADEAGKRELLSKSGITFAMSITGIAGKRSKSNAGITRSKINVPPELQANMRRSYA